MDTTDSLGKVSMMSRNLGVPAEYRKIIKADDLSSSSYAHLTIVVSMLVFVCLDTFFYTMHPQRYFSGFDDLGYIVTAQNIVLNHVIMFLGDTKPSVYVMPGYPLWIAGFYAVFGVGHYALWMVRTSQMFMMIGSAVLVYHMAKRYFGVLIGVLAFEACLFLPDFVLTPLFLYTEALFFLLSTATFYAAILLYEHPIKKHMAIFSILLGMSLLVRPTIAIFPTVFLFWMVLSHRISWRILLTYASMGILICSLMLMPWWIRNATIYHTFIPFTASSGNPLLYGTFPIGYSTKFPAKEPTFIVMTARERHLFQKKMPSLYERDHADRQIAFQNLRYEWHKNPLRVIASYTIGKFINFYTAMDWFGSFPRITSIQRILIHWTFIFLAVIGLIKYRKTAYVHVLLLYAISTQVVYQIYLSMARYSLPVEFLLTPLAVLTLVRIVKALY